MCLMFVTKSVTGYYTPQFLSQMKSDLHEIFSVLQDWSPEWIHNVCAHARASVHAQHMETCTQLWAKNKPLGSLQKKYFFRIFPIPTPPPPCWISKPLFRSIRIICNFGLKWVKILNKVQNLALTPLPH